MKTDNSTEGAAPAAGLYAVSTRLSPLLPPWPAPPAISTIPEDQTPSQDGEETQDLGVFRLLLRLSNQSPFQQQITVLQTYRPWCQVRV